MIEITDDIKIDEAQITIKPLYSTGPGGQNVNKNMTAIQLRFDISNCESLSIEIKKRLIALSGRRVSGNGILIITARNHRSQERNKNEVFERLFDLIRRAATAPKLRLKRRRSAAVDRRRLENKRKQSDTKRLRNRAYDDS